MKNQLYLQDHSYWKLNCGCLNVPEKPNHQNHFEELQQGENIDSNWISVKAKTDLIPGQADQPKEAAAEAVQHDAPRQREAQEEESDGSGKELQFTSDDEEDEQEQVPMEEEDPADLLQRSNSELQETLIN